MSSKAQSNERHIQRPSASLTIYIIVVHQVHRITQQIGFAAVTQMMTHRMCNYQQQTRYHHMLQLLSHFLPTAMANEFTHTGCHCTKAVIYHCC